MRRIILVLTAALVLAAMTVVAVPAMAQQPKEEPKMEEKGKENEKMKEEDLPKSGGLDVVDASVLGLTAGVLLIGGGLVVRKVVRQEQ